MAALQLAQATFRNVYPYAFGIDPSGDVWIGYQLPEDLEKEIRQWMEDCGRETQSAAETGLPTPPPKPRAARRRRLRQGAANR